MIPQHHASRLKEIQLEMAERKAGPRTSKPFTTRREKKDSKKNAFQKLAKLKSREGEISLSRS